eukprot:COSAG04_NODE_475_length_13749_cov_11.148498_3_plen_583_part_00
MTNRRSARSRAKLEDEAAAAWLEDPQLTPAGPGAAESEETTYPDEHARLLAGIGNVQYHLPEETIAKRIGFDGDVSKLRAWVRALKLQGRDVWEFNAYEDQYGTEKRRFWLCSDVAKPTNRDIGIKSRVLEQMAVVDVLEDDLPALRYGLNGVGDTAAAEGWRNILEFAYAHARVFHIERVVKNYHASAGRRTTGRQLESAFIAQLNRMVDVGAVSLEPKNTASKNTASKSTASKSPPENSHKKSSPMSTFLPAKSLSKVGKHGTIPRVVNFKAVSAADRYDRQSYDDRARIASALMTECCVSQNNQGKLLAGILQLWGHTIEGSIPTRHLAQVVQEEAGILAFSMQGEQILRWGIDGSQDVCACIDAVSIGEYKGESAALVKPTWVEEKGRRVKKWVRVASPLIALSDGTDDTKQSALVNSFDDIVSCYNVVNADCEDGEQMSMYDIARVVGFTCNDHAESVVKNRFAPWVTESSDDSELAQLPGDSVHPLTPPGSGYKSLAQSRIALGITDQSPEENSRLQYLMGIWECAWCAWVRARRVGERRLWEASTADMPPSGACRAHRRPSEAAGVRQSSKRPVV